MSEQSKTPQWVKFALAIQAIVICVGLLLYVASIRLVSHVQLPTRAENRAFVEVSTDAPAAASPYVPGQPSGVTRSPPGRMQSMPLPYRSESDPSLRTDNFLPAPSLSTPMESDTAVVNPTLSNAQPSNPQPSNPPNSKKEHSNEEVTNQTVSDSEAPNSNPSAVNETIKQETFPGSKNEIRFFQLQQGSAGEMTKTVKEIFDNLVKVSADERSNSLIVVASPPTLEKVADFIEGMERLAKIAFVEEMKRLEAQAVAKVKFADGHETATIETQPTQSESLLAKQQALQKLMRAFGADHPKVRAAQDQINAEQARLAEESLKRESQPVVATVDDMKASTRKFPSDERDAELDRQAKQLALQIRTARQNEKAKLKKELEAITRKQFEHRQNRRREEFDSLSQRVERLKASYQRRQAQQDQVIQRRINELIDPNTDLRWDATEVATDSLSSRDEAANAIKAAIQDTSSATATPLSKSPPKNSDESDPTYNSVTLSQWMRLLETERNIEKISEAVKAMNHLMDQADPTQLTRAILHIIRVHGSKQGDHTTSVIRNGSVNLLKLLPSEIVVEELIAELAASSSRKPTQDFYAYFFSSVNSEGATDNHISKINLSMSGSNDVTAVEQSVLSDANQRLRVEIRRRSRRLIGVLVNAATKDKSLADWAMRCAGLVVHISDQPITTYPGLVTLVEYVFDHPVDVPKGASPFDRRLVVAILLGESGLRIPDVLAYGTERIQQDDDKPFGTQFNDGVRCLVAIAPFSSDAVNLLAQTMETKWTAVLDFDDKLKTFNALNGNDSNSESDIGNGGSKKGQPDEAAGNKLKFQCKRIIEALAEIGMPAVPAIPKLTAIAESPKIVEFATYTNILSVQMVKFQDVARSAIKKIEEAKPKAAPLPLPVDDAISTPVSIPVASNRKPGESASSRDTATNAINAATRETSPVNATSPENSLPKKPDRSGPTYNGVTLSEWFLLLEFERNPEKIVEAVMAMHYLKDQADARQLTKTIIRLMRFQGSSTSDHDGNVIMNGSVLLLKLLPSEIVVDELIAEITASSSLKPTRDFCMYFFNSIGWKGTTDVFVGSPPFKMVDRKILAESTERLRAEIKRRSRRLISTLINVADQDESLAYWVMHCANVVVHVSDQRITAYPGLVPLVEKQFDNPVKSPSNVVDRVFTPWPVAEPLLGESGLRVPEILELATEKIRDYLDNGTFQFEYGIRCLIAIAPSSPDAVKLLGETLATKWKTLLELRDEQIVNTQNREIQRIIDALAEIGNPAVPAIPRLAAIADFRKLINGPVESGMGTMMGMPMGGMAIAPAKTFQELAKSAIKKIEEAKPRPDPQPLPDDIEISTLVLLPIASSGKPGDSRDTTYQIAPRVVKSVSDPLPVETTYDGVGYSKWLELLETERKPEKLMAAIEACSQVAAKGDERRIARRIFLAEGYFAAKDWDNERSDLWKAGYDALVRLPGDAVVDELLHALRDEKSYSTGRGFQIDFLTRGEEIPHVAQMRDKAGEIIDEMLKLSSRPTNSQGTRNGLLAAASSVWRDSGRPMKDFDGLWPQMQKLLTDGFADANSNESSEWITAATNVVVGAPDTPHLANILLTHVKKHHPNNFRLIGLIGMLGSRAEAVVPDLVDLFMVEWKKLESLPSAIRWNIMRTYSSSEPNADELNSKRLAATLDQTIRIKLIRTLGEIGVGASSYNLLSELKLISAKSPRNFGTQLLDEIFPVVDKALLQFGSNKYPRDEKRFLGDRWRINGRWKLVTRFENSDTAERQQEISIQIRDDLLIWDAPVNQRNAFQKFMEPFSIQNPNMATVDDTKSPKQLMLTTNIGESNRGRRGEAEKHSMVGIYEVTDFKLKIQFAKPDQPSPTEFTNQMGQVPEDQMLLEFERIVPEPTKNAVGRE